MPYIEVVIWSRKTIGMKYYYYTEPEHYPSYLMMLDYWN